MNKILVIAAHPDDEILGLGATIKKHTMLGDIAECIILGEGLTSRDNESVITSKSQVQSLHQNALSSGTIIGYRQIHFAGFPDNSFDSVPLLKIIKYIENIIDKYNPNIIYTHHSGDRNIDHRITFDAVLTSSRPTIHSSINEIYTFETPSSTEWAFDDKKTLFNPNVFIDVTDTIEYKLKAMACYITEIRDYPHPRSLEGLKIIAQRWGTVVGKKYVEAFHLVRKIN